MNEQTKQYYRTTYTTWENLCNAIDKAISTYAAALEEYRKNRRKGGKNRQFNIQLIQGRMLNLELQKTECKEAWEI